MPETVRETKRADELQPGDWTVYLGKARDFDGIGRAKVLFAQPYTDDVGNAKVYVTVAEEGFRAPQSARIAADDKVQLLTEEEVRDSREQTERAQKIADIRAFADWLEANPEIPMAYGIGGQADLSESLSYSAAEIDAVRAFAEKHGGEFKEGKDHASARIRFGGVTYSVISWYKDGRPAEPALEPEDPTGLGYSRTDGELAPGIAVTVITPTDPAVADVALTRPGRRVEPHTGAVTDEGLVDETPVEIAPCWHGEVAPGRECPGSGPDCGPAF